MSVASGGGRDRAVDLALRALARRDHSVRGLGRKLERAGVSERAQAEALETLVAAGYLDDVRFARDRAAQLADRGYGDEYIRADLETQGVGGEHAALALASLEPEAGRALREAGRLGIGAKAVRALGRRGFSEDSLERVIAGAVAEEA